MALEAEHDDELCDLSPEDSRQFRAFSEKRRWFERKLAVLEALPPIHPFLNPILLPAESSQEQARNLPYRRQHDGEGHWALPTSEQVKQWQDERDESEEEILAFDGGDLGRMKDKIRAATLLPLASPSTRLVSITLALIGLIDRLLSLLRHRSELLELTSLRLQWDDLRWQAAQDAQILSKEVDDLVRKRGRWVPEGVIASKPRTPRTPRTSLSRDDDNVADPVEALATPRNLTVMFQAPVTKSSPDTPLVAPAGAADRSSLLPKLGPLTPRASVEQTPSPNRDSTRRGFRFHLLHSCIVNLEIRHRNLSSTSLARTETLLDKMIGLAGPLKDLEGIIGTAGVSSGQGRNAGAVPDELLDIEDALEAEVGEIGSRVAWCKLLEKQWELADSHLSASKHTSGVALELIDQLQTSLNQPATSEQHLQLATRLEIARSKLDEPIDPTFSRPSHPAYAEQNAHNEQVVEVLDTAHKQAEGHLEEANAGLSWYASLARARVKVAEQAASMSKLLDQLKRETESVVQSRPDFDNPTHLAAAHASSLSVLNVPKDVAMWVQEAFGTAQRSTVMIMRYRQIMRAPPRAWRTRLPTSMYTDDLVEEVERDVDELFEAARRAAKIILLAEQDASILPIAQGIIQATASMSRSAAALWIDLNAAIATSAWRSGAIGPINQTFPEVVQKTKKRLQEEIIQPLLALEELLRVHGRALPVLHRHLFSLEARTKAETESLDKLANLLELVKQQAGTIWSVEKEAVEFLRKIQIVQSEVDSLHDETNIVEQQVQDIYDVRTSILPRIDNLAVQIATWESRLPQRVIFVSTQMFTSENIDERHSQHSKWPVIPEETARPLLPANVSAVEPPLTPPISPASSNRSLHSGSAEPSVSLMSAESPRLSISTDLIALDRDVRMEVNTQASRVASAISHTRLSLTLLESQHSSRKLSSLTDELKTTLERWRSANEEIRAREDSLRSWIDTRNSVKAAEDAVHDFEALQTDVIPTNRALASRIADLAAHLESFLFVHIPANDPVTFGDKTVDRTVLLTSAKRVPEEELQIKTEVEALLLNAQARLERIMHNAQTVVNQNDVFGPTAAVASDQLARSTSLSSTGISPSAIGDRIRKLNDQLDALHIDLIVNPSISALHDRPSLRQLPDRRVAGHIEDEVQSVSKQSASLAVATAHASQTAHQALDDAICAAARLLPKLGRLATLSGLFKTCDGSLSRLLEAIDCGSVLDVQRASEEASIAVENVKETAQSINDDSRVAGDVSRILRAWTDLQVMVVDRLQARQTSENGRAGRRSASNPTTAASAYLTPTQASRNRIVSDTATRLQLSGFNGDRLPRTSIKSNGHTASLRSIFPVPRTPTSTSGASRASNHKASTVSGPRMSRRLPFAKAYIADPKNELDMAVGKIVDVPIVPVGLDSGDEWKDQSGRYWIGAEGRAKLCFCRILRSQTVMIRIGGGWVELSQFLLDHFADAFGSRQKPASTSPNTKIGSDNPIPFTSVAFAADATPMRMTYPSSTLPSRSATQPSSTFEPSVRFANLTPVRKALPQPIAYELRTPDPPTPLSRRHSSLIPETAEGLDPLQFILKASESPPIRDREKQRLKAGRRSIWGREGSSVGF